MGFKIQLFNARVTYRQQILFIYSFQNLQNILPTRALNWLSSVPDGQFLRR